LIVGLMKYDAAFIEQKKCSRVYAPRYQCWDAVEVKTLIEQFAYFGAVWIYPFSDVLALDSRPFFA